MINNFNTLAISFQIVLTKCDKILIEQQDAFQEKIDNMGKKWPALFNQIIKTSSTKNYGIKDLQWSLIELLKFL